MKEVKGGPGWGVREEGDGQPRKCNPVRDRFLGLDKATSLEKRGDYHRGRRARFFPPPLSCLGAIHPEKPCGLRWSAGKVPPKPAFLGEHHDASAVTKMGLDDLAQPLCLERGGRWRSG